MSEAANARARLLTRFKTDLIGPGSEDEVLSERPSARYLTAILYPQQSEISEEEDESIAAENGDGEAENEERDAVSLLRTFKPATCGLSFSVSVTDEDAVLLLDLSYARYSADEKNDDEGKREGRPRLEWVRRAEAFPDVPISVAAGSDDFLLAEGLQLYRRVRREGAYATVTIQFVNLYRELSRGSSLEDKPTDTLVVQGLIASEEASFFQFAAEIRCSVGCCFVPRRTSFRGNDEDERVADLIYRDCAEYAVGHTASASWLPETDPEKLLLTWMPEAVVQGMDASGDAMLQDRIAATALGRLHGLELALADDESLFAAIEALAQGYEDWIDTQEAEVSKLPETLTPQARENIKRCCSAANRIRQGIAFLRRGGKGLTAFRLANRAMYIQAAWAAKRPEAAADIDAGAFKFEWRPFQLAFALMCLPSAADREHDDRGIFDLIWFPTGGGKTEAYLLLSAFVLFYRRFKHGVRGAGVNIIMRYTLRTLTVQQFQRAAALVLACETLRLTAGEDLGANRFSIGLWVGGDSTPNRFSDAAEALFDYDATSTPRQLTRCPVCASELEWSSDKPKRRINCHCPSESCRAARPEGVIPVMTVDDDLYAETPSLLIGTVDKFAQIVRKAESGALFGTNGAVEPPDLIIQDELHLIGGPLGSLTGLYEAAVDRLCGTPKGPPKIVGSTATIRRADEQVRAVFNRRAFQFPPPALDWSNSCFAKVREDDGRLYVGLTTAGRSEKFALQAASASLLQAEMDPAAHGNPAFDAYATLVAYFNSLKVLGGALVLMEDDVRITVDALASRRGETPRKLGNPEELTSRKASAEIPLILDRLNLPYTNPEAVDVLLASNMLSVGVDIPRLGLMLVNGQPKYMAEYIQATSRVGRREPGLVVTLFNNNKIRDRAHFETFASRHAALYRSVEPSSVTPFAPRARDKALHAPLVALVRHLINPTSASAAVADRVQVMKLVEEIIDRIQAVDSGEVSQARTELTQFVVAWIEAVGDGRVKSYWDDRRLQTSLLLSAEEAAARRATGKAEAAAVPTPNSVRNVEPGVDFLMKERV
ncbi:MAG: helicase-related protein [Pseudomonadota bacterium]